MTDLQAYFKQQAAIHLLPVLMARKIARDAQARSDRTRAGNLTKAARRAGA